MKIPKKLSKGKVATEDRVRNAVVGHIAQKGYSRNLKIKSGDQHGVDIFATHASSDARRIFIEAKGNTPGCNKHLSILTGLGQLVGRVTSLNPNRTHGLAFPKEWEKNVAKLLSPLVAKMINLHYFFVDTHGNVEELTAAKFHKTHSTPRTRSTRKKLAKRRR